MFQVIRKVFGPAAVSVIIGAIALVFVFFGVFNPKGAGPGGSGGGTVATVNGESIPFREYYQEYQARVEFYQNMLKGKADVNMLKQLGLQRQVIEELITKKLMLQEAERLGLRCSDEEVRDKIREMPYFADKKGGTFDPATYRRVLEANHRSAGEFEDLIRQDVTRNRFMEFVRGSVRVTNQEVEQEFLVSENRRQVDYVSVSPMVVRKALKLDEKDLEKTRKATKEMGQEVFAKSKIMNRAEFKKWVKTKGLEYKTSEKFNRSQDFVPGIGEMPDLINDAFAENSVLAKEPKLYEARGDMVIAMSLQTFKPNTADLGKNKDKVLKSVQSKKEQEMYTQLMTSLRSQSKVSMNDKLLNMEMEGN